MILYLPIETKAREFDSKVLIAFEALKEGFDVVIGNLNDSFQSANFLKEGSFLYKDHSPWVASKFNKLNENNIDIYALDEEGILFVDENSYINRTSKESINYCNTVFTWGKNQKTILSREYGNEITNFQVSGNPRFDIYQKKFSQYLDIISLQYIDERNFILINSNFTAYNWLKNYYGSDTYVEHITKMGIIKNETDKLFYEEFVENVKQQFLSFVSLIKEISTKHPQQLIVVRPHPSEDFKVWEKEFKEYNNVKVIFFESASYWMKRAKCLIHINCTTGIEARAIGIPVFVYSNLKKNKFNDFELANVFGDEVNSQEEMIAIIDELIVNPNYQYKNDKLLNFSATEHIHNFYEFSAANEIIKVIKKDYKAKSTNSEDILIKLIIQHPGKLSLLKKTIYKMGLLPALKRIKVVLKPSLKKSKSLIEYQKMDEITLQKFQGISKNDIDFRLNALNDLFKSNLKFKTHELHGNALFYIQNKR